jgi:hypothetical protein
LFGERGWPFHIFEELKNSLQIVVLPLEQLEVWCKRIKGCNCRFFYGTDW